MDCQTSYPLLKNWAIFIWKILNEEIKKLGAQLHCVKVCETENNYVEYFGG